MFVSFCKIIVASTNTWLCIYNVATESVKVVMHLRSAGVVGILELLVMPLQHRALVEATASRWINAKPSKYAKYIAHFLDSVKCAEYVRNV